jgi:hypothetical protein
MAIPMMFITGMMSTVFNTIKEKLAKTAQGLRNKGYCFPQKLLVETNISSIRIIMKITKARYRIGVNSSGCFLKSWSMERILRRLLKKEKKEKFQCCS